MGSDAPPALPLDTPPDSPFRREPEQPRLGIIHLLGWTTCVAVQFSVIRAFAAADWVPSLEPSLVLAAGVEIGQATALGGLVLWAARRYRRLRFPGQPGETLLVLLGIGAAISLVQRPLYYSAAQLQTLPWLLSLFAFLEVLLLAVLYLIAAVKTTVPRWRAYFVTVLVTGAIAFILLLLMSLLLSPAHDSLRAFMPLISRSPQIIPAALLLLVAVIDSGQRPRYRWTHWLGIGLGLWNGVMNVMLGVWVARFFLS
jgi:hypothetical protein